MRDKTLELTIVNHPATASDVRSELKRSADRTDIATRVRVSGEAEETSDKIEHVSLRETTKRRQRSVSMPNATVQAPAHRFLEFFFDPLVSEADRARRNSIAASPGQLLALVKNSQSRRLVHHGSSFRS